MLTGTATVASVWSVSSIAGTVYWYLVIWVAALPLALAIGYVDLVATYLADRSIHPGAAIRAGNHAGRWIGSGIGAALLVAGVGASLSLGGAAVKAPDSPRVAAVDLVLDQGLPAAVGVPGAVHVAIGDPTAWPVAAGVVRHLERAGWTVSVDQDWVDVFGPQ